MGNPIWLSAIYTDFDVFKNKAYSSGYTKIKISSVDWKYGSDANFNTNWVNLSDDKILSTRIKISGFKNSSWTELSTFTNYCWFGTKEKDPITLWSTQGAWTLNITNPNKLPFYYEMMSGNNV